MEGGRGRGLSSWPDSSRRLRDLLLFVFRPRPIPFCITIPGKLLRSGEFLDRDGRGEGLKEKLHFRESFNRGERAWNVLFKRESVGLGISYIGSIQIGIQCRMNGSDERWFVRFF